MGNAQFNQAEEVQIFNCSKETNISDTISLKLRKFDDEIHTLLKFIHHHNNRSFIISAELF